MFYYMFVEGMLLVVVVYMLFYIIFYKSEAYMEMVSSYECGFDPSSSARLVFSYKFFLISILFIVFDVEISLMISVPFFMMSSLGVFVFFLFIFVLILGLVYEYYYGALDWLRYYKDYI